MTFEGKSKNQGFRTTINNISDILDPNQGTIIAIASYNGNTVDRGVCGYRSDNYYKNELSILYNETWFRGDIYSSGVSLGWTNPINNTPSIRSSRFIRTDNVIWKKVTISSFYNSNTDNENINPQVSSSAGDLSNFGNKSFSIGEIYDVHFYKGSIAEVIVLNTAASDAERLKVESYLAIKHGVTLGTIANPASYTSSTGSEI